MGEEDTIKKVVCRSGEIGRRAGLKIHTPPRDLNS